MDDNCGNFNAEHEEKRIMVITDELPLYNANSPKNIAVQCFAKLHSLPQGLVSNNILKKTYTSYFCIGSDVDQEVLSAIAKVRGANYFTVIDTPSFRNRIDTEFDNWVTPLIFDLSTLQAYCI
jgi:hypothetical protein